MNARIPVAVGAALLTLAVAGCRDTPSTPNALPSPTVTIDSDFRALKVRSRAAIAANDALGPQTTTAFAEPEFTTAMIAGPCGTQWPVSDLYNHSGGLSQGWKLAGGLRVWQYALGYKVVTGQQVIADMAGRLTCKQYDLERDPSFWALDGGKVGFEVVADPPAFDGLGPVLMFCESATNARCSALMSRDNMVSRVTVVADTRTAAEAELRKDLSVFAKHFASAW